MAQSKKSPAKPALKKAGPRKPEKAAHSKKPPAKLLAKTPTPKAGSTKTAKTAAVRSPAARAGSATTKADTTKPAAAKATAKSKAAAPARSATTAASKTKVKTEVPVPNKKNATAAKAPVKPAASPVAARPAASKGQAGKAAPAKVGAASVGAKPVAAKAAAVAKAPVAAKVTKGTAAALMAARAKAPVAPGARAIPAAVHKSAARMTTSPSMPVLPAQPTAPRGAASPKEIALKAAEVRRQQMLTPKKPVNSRHGFKIGESIVYPAHGVGQIVGIEEQEIAGMSLELFVINFEKEKLTLRVPTGKLESVGMRKLADDGIVGKAMEILKGRARIKRTMWSRRAQEYVAKINSGDLISIAEVVRDLYRSEAQPEQSYSERQLYEDALDRMAREIAAVEKLDDRGAVQRITDVLSKSARGRRAAEAEAEASGEVKAA